MSKTAYPVTVPQGPGQTAAPAVVMTYVDTNGNVQEVTSANPLPIAGSASDSVASGSITALNANGTTGPATAGSAVIITLNNNSSVTTQITGTWNATLAYQVTVDGTNWTTVGYYFLGAIINTGGMGASVGAGANGVHTINTVGCAQARIVSTAYTSGTAVISMRANDAAMSPMMGLASVGAYLQQINFQSPLMQSSPGGASGGALVTSVASSTTQVVYSAVSVVTSAKTALATITESNGIGTVCSFFINLSAFTAGTSTGLDIFLQWSPDGGTTFYDLWHVEAFTAAGTAFIPPVYIPGRWRFAYQNRTGAATTATLTITATRLNLANSVNQRQYFDRTAGVLAGTGSSFTGAYEVSGCKVVTAAIYLNSKATTSDPVYQIQTSADGISWSPSGATTSTLIVGGNEISIVNNSKRFVRLYCNTAGTGTAQNGYLVAITASN